MKCGATGKVMHATRSAAMIARKALKAGKGIELQAYRCDACKRWHLGNTPDTRLQNMNRLFDRIAARGTGQPG